MTDLTPEQSEAVRRLLAEARADEPMPADVVARLDGVLAELATASPAPALVPASPEEAPLAPVVPIRRRWPAVLLAAAAVTAIAYGTTQVVGPQPSSDDAGTAERSVAGDSGAGTEDGADEELAPEAVAPSPTSSTTRVPLDLGYAQERDLVTGLSELIESGARAMDGPWLDAYIPDLSPVSNSAAAKELDTIRPQSDGFNTASGLNRFSGTTCGPLDPFPLSTAYAALYRDHAALVVVLPAIDGRHTVQVFDCQGSSPRLAVETVTVPVGQLPPGE